MFVLQVICLDFMKINKRKLHVSNKRCLRVTNVTIKYVFLVLYNRCFLCCIIQFNDAWDGHIKMYCILLSPDTYSLFHVPQWVRVNACILKAEYIRGFLHSNYLIFDEWVSEWCFLLDVLKVIRNTAYLRFHSHCLFWYNKVNGLVYTLYSNYTKSIVQPDGMFT